MYEVRTEDKKDTLTHWSNPSETIASGYGKISYREWCEKEMARINKSGDSVKIVELQDGSSKNGFIALSR